MKKGNVKITKACTTELNAVKKTAIASFSYLRCFLNMNYHLVIFCPAQTESDA